MGWDCHSHNNVYGHPGQEFVELVDELTVMPQVDQGKEMTTPSSCDIAVSDIEDDKSATTSHPEIEGNESEIVGIPDLLRLSSRNRKPPTRFGWED